MDTGMTPQWSVLDEPGTQELADLISDRITHDGAYHDHDQHEQEVDMVQRGEDSADEGGGLSGDDEAEEYRSFAEDEQTRTPHRRGALGNAPTTTPRLRSGSSPPNEMCCGQRAQGAQEALTQVRRRHAGQVMKRV